MTLIALSDIQDGGAQMRVEMKPDVVREYADDMADGAIFPPVIVYFDGTDYWLGDGFHRVEAARKLERETINAEVRDGDVRQAVLHGIGSNASHGLRRTQADKRTAGNREVYAYRFDWDEEGVVDGRDLSVALGAGHALEIPFVFGDFETGLPLGDFFQNSPEKELLAGSMMSYWSQFAASGNPGRGQSGDGVEWLAWDADASTTLVLDTPSDQGIYMTDGVVSAASIKAELAADPEIADALERCTHYSRIFGYSRHFDTDEYADFGPDGCAQFDPAEIRGF